MKLITLNNPTSVTLNIADDYYVTLRSYGVTPDHTLTANYPNNFPNGIISASRYNMDKVYKSGKTYEDGYASSQGTVTVSATNIKIGSGTTYYDNMENGSTKYYTVPEPKLENVSKTINWRDVPEEVIGVSSFTCEARDRGYTTVNPTTDNVTLIVRWSSGWEGVSDKIKTTYVSAVSNITDNSTEKSVTFTAKVTCDYSDGLSPASITKQGTNLPGTVTNPPASLRIYYNDNSAVMTDAYMSQYSYPTLYYNAQLALPSDAELNALVKRLRGQIVYKNGASSSTIYQLNPDNGDYASDAPKWWTAGRYWAGMSTWTSGTPGAASSLQYITIHSKGVSGKVLCTLYNADPEYTGNKAMGGGRPKWEKAWGNGATEWTEIGPDNLE